MKRLLNKKFNNLLLLLLLVIFNLSVSTANVNAASALSLSPSSGTKSANFTVAILLNSSPALSGIDFDVNYTGAIEYVSGVGGNIGCTPVITEVSSSKVNILCLGFPLNGSGTVATLTFAPSGTGSASISMAVIDDGDSGTTTSGGTYTITSGSSAGGGGTTGGTTDGENLPNTDGSQNSLLFIGGMLFFMGMGLTMTLVGLERFTKEVPALDGTNSDPMGNKV